MLMDDRWFTPGEVAERLHFHRTCINAFLRRRRLPSVRVGRVCRITPAGPNRFLFSDWHVGGLATGLEPFNV